MSKHTTIKFTDTQRDYIAKCAKENDKAMGEWAYQCVFFMKKHRYDPYDYQDIQLAEEFKKFQKQIVGFIRMQERNFLVPLKETVNGMASSQKEFSFVLESFVSENAGVVDDLPTEQATPSKKDDSKLSLELERLSRIIDKKDEELGKYREAMKSIKSASLLQKGKVYLNLTEGRFKEIVSLS